MSAAMYAETLTPMPNPLQATWGEQRKALHSYGIIINPVARDLAEHAGHAAYAGIKAAKSFTLPMPLLG